MREIRLKIEVLPAPLGPMIEKISPLLHGEADVIDRLQAAEIDDEVLGPEVAHRFRSDFT